MCNPLQIYTEYQIMQVIAREIPEFVDNLTVLLIKTMHFVDFFEISTMIGV